MASVRIEHAYNVVVRVEAQNGLVGWGESASAPTMTGETMESMAVAVRDYLAPLVVGENALDRAVLAQRLARAMHHNSGAKAALDVAINDLVGRHLGVSLTDLLGGPLRRSLLPMYLLGNAKPEDDVAEARAKADEGFRFLKLKCGVKKIEVDLELGKAVRHAVGDDVMLCADANMGMSMQNARRYVEGATEFALAFLEQPLGVENLDGMAELAKVSPIPLCIDESCGSIPEILAYQRAGAIRGVNLKVLKCGGFASTMRTASVCDVLGLSIGLACKVAESSIGAAALVHVGYTIGNLDWGISLSNVYLADDLVKKPLLPYDGEIERPTGPGLGVEIDEHAVERYRVK